MSLTWQMLAGPLHRTDSARLTRLLLDAGESERLAFAAEVSSRVRADAGPSGCLALLVIACMPTAARAADLLARRSMRGWHEISAGHFLEIARARRLPWLGDLAVRLAGRLPREPWTGDWRFVEALLVAGDAEPPVTEGVVRGWLAAVSEDLWMGRSGSPADVLRGSPWLDLLVPPVFEIDGLGGGLPASREDGAPFPTAIAQLVAEGRLDRKTILDATVGRLARTDRPAFLRPFALLHDALAPTPAEMAAFVGDYARLLPEAASPIAGLAQRALQSLDDAGLLGLETLLDLSPATLLRSEKVLVRAQLTWLSRAARREPERAAEILEAVSAAFGHPALDIHERALTVVAASLPELSPAEAMRVAGAAAGLSGALRAQARALFGTALPAAYAAGGTSSSGPLPAPVETAARVPAPRTAPAPPPVETAARVPAPRTAPAPAPAETTARMPAPRTAPMPAPIGTAAELAEELAALAAEPTATGWERAMAGIVTLHAAADPDGLAEVLGPVLGRCGYEEARDDDAWFLGQAVNAVIGRPRREDRRPAHFNVPPDVLTARLAELSTWLTASPVPVLLATPTHVSGSIDATVLIDRLALLEDAGRDPWPFDFEQALLRVTPAGDSGARAAELTSPEGLRLAAWLGSDRRPEPLVNRVEQLAGDTKNGFWIFDAGIGTTRRVVAGLAPTEAPGSLPLLGRSVFTIHRGASPREDYEHFHHYRPDVLAMVLPHDREAVAAWALPEIAALADHDSREATALPMLADCAGPAGSATALALAYGLGARHLAGRAAAVDTLLAVARPGEPITAMIGTELGSLCADGTVKLVRVVAALADAHAAGATVWDLLAAALPLLLPAAPRGLPDLLELATRIADATGRRGEIAGLAEVAGRGGASRLVREARRLHAVLGLDH